MAPTFLACLVILCFEKQRHKQKYCCSPKFKHFAPPLNFGLATPLGHHGSYSSVYVCVYKNKSVWFIQQKFDRWNKKNETSFWKLNAEM